jgi:hypothetical protein
MIIKICFLEEVVSRSGKDGDPHADPDPQKCVTVQTTAPCDLSLLRSKVHTFFVNKGTEQRKMRYGPKRSLQCAVLCLHLVHTNKLIMNGVQSLRVKYRKFYAGDTEYGIY